jgi:WD40 repeat protein
LIIVAHSSELEAFNTKELAPLGKFVGHEKFVLAVDASPDAPQVASGGRDYSVKIWDIET